MDTPQPSRIFISYSHKDDSYREALDTHLSLMKRQGVVDVWCDRRIVEGEEFDPEIAKNLERADIILLLVSADFIASDYCYEKEMERAMQRHDGGQDDAWADVAKGIRRAVEALTR